MLPMPKAREKGVSGGSTGPLPDNSCQWQQRPGTSARQWRQRPHDSPCQWQQRARHGTTCFAAVVGRPVCGAGSVPDNSGDSEVSIADSQAAKADATGGTQQLSRTKNWLSLQSNCILSSDLTDDAARLIVRLNEPGNGFETWRQLHERFALPSRAKGVSLLSQLLEHQFRDAHFEADLTAFIVLKSKHGRATNTALSDDWLVTLMMNKTRGQLQQRLRLQDNTLKTFDQVVVIVKEYYQSRHLVSGKLHHDPQGHQGPAHGLEPGTANHRERRECRLE